MTKRAATLCAYGESGVRKTTSVGRFARYIYQRTGKRTRLISADGGGWQPCQAEIDAGLIEPVNLLEAQNPLPALRHLMRGEWWKDNRWTTDGLKDVAAYAIEGLTSISVLALRDVTNKGRKIAENVATPFVEDGEHFAAPAQAHYGFVQNFLLDSINSFSGLPVEYVLYTAHEGKGEDYITKELTYGPASVGKKATEKIPPMVGDLFHFFIVNVQDKKDAPIRSEVRAYFQSHPNPQTGVNFPAKVRLQPDQVKALERRWPDGYFLLDHHEGLDTFLEVRDELLQKSSSALREWMEQVEKGRKG